MMMPVCPVCGSPLMEGKSAWRCENNHSFDRARQGYVNLLTVDRKHSLHPGDTKEMVAARKAFLDAGYYAPIAARVCELLAPQMPQTILDAGCGEGYYLTKVGEAFPSAELWGIDISKDAVRFAAVRNKRAHWLTATAAVLPFESGSFDAVLSMFALTVPQEYARVLKKDGLFLQVLAGPEHLMGLKRIIYPQILQKEKLQKQALEGFSLLSHSVLEFPFSLTEHTQVQNLLSMTPHLWRISKEGAARLAQTERLEDTAQVVFNLYRKQDGETKE